MYEEMRNLWSEPDNGFFKMEWLERKLEMPSVAEVKLLSYQEELIKNIKGKLSNRIQDRIIKCDFVFRDIADEDFSFSYNMVMTASVSMNRNVYSTSSFEDSVRTRGVRITAVQGQKPTKIDWRRDGF